MTTSDDPRNEPLAEGKRQSGSDVGGVRSAPEASSAGATPAADDRAAPARPAAPRAAAASPSGGAAKPGWDDDEEPWRHAPVAPRDEGPLKSFGRSISDTVTGPVEDKPAKPKA
jgi:hypothetical protein